MNSSKSYSGYKDAGGYLRHLVRLASFGGLFLSLSSTLFIWAGASAFRCSPTVWKASLLISVGLFFLTWLAYWPFRNTDMLIGHGFISFFMMVSLFFLFGFSMFYFYFLFAPLNTYIRGLVLIFTTSMFAYRAGLIVFDIKETFLKNKNLFQKIYLDEGELITHSRESFTLLQKSRKDRNPFKSFYLYTGLAIGPFVLVWNRLLTPLIGDGHGIFLVLAFFAIPILLWGIESTVQIIMITIYYPIKLQRESGKLVLLKDW